MNILAFQSYVEEGERAWLGCWWTIRQGGSKAVLGGLRMNFEETGSPWSGSNIAPANWDAQPRGWAVKQINIDYSYCDDGNRVRRWLWLSLAWTI